MIGLYLTGLLAASNFAYLGAIDSCDGGACNLSVFSVNLSGTQCFNLGSHAVANESQCADICCNDPACIVYQYCPPGYAACGAPATPQVMSIACQSPK
jgi:hypothetical protein